MIFALFVLANAGGVRTDHSSDASQSNPPSESLRHTHSDGGGGAFARTLLITTESCERVLNAPPDRFPYMASVRNFASHWCGGALVSPRWVLTAAHCVDQNSRRSVKGSNPLVHIGALSINNISQADAIITTKTVIHPKWTGIVSLGFDVALLLLGEFSSKTPISLPERTLEVSEKRSVITLGWGTDEVSGNFSSILREAPDLSVFPLEKCKQLWKGSIVDEMICAAPRKASKCQRVCEGDSGGPLVLPARNSPLKPNQTDVLLGIATFSPDYCGQNESLQFQPDVFSSVLAVLDWIHSVTASPEPLKLNTGSCMGTCVSICKSPRSTAECKSACQAGNDVQCCSNDVGATNFASSDCLGKTSVSMGRMCGKQSCVCGREFTCKEI